MTPLVSVCIPTYNNPEGLKKTLDCIRRQSYKNLEIIVSVNPSPDEETTRKVLTTVGNIERYDTRIEIYQQFSNIGVDDNYRFVADHATGKYFMFAQDDDWWSEKFIENLVRELERDSDIVVAASPARYMVSETVMSGLQTLRNISVFNVVGNGALGLACMGLWRRESFSKYEIRLPIYVIGGDHMTIAHVLMAGKRVSVVDSELYLKGYKKGAFQNCFNCDFWYSFRSWYWLLKILAESPKIPSQRKLLIPFVAVTNLFRACAVTGVQIIVSLPEDNPIRKIIQRRFFGAN